MKVLVLGDGNFSYSLALSRCIVADVPAAWESLSASSSSCPSSISPSSTPASRKRGRKLSESFELVATTVDSREEILFKYRESKGILSELNRLGVTVDYKVNATAISESGLAKFDRIIFNHPHTGTEDFGLHASLLAHFFHSALSHLLPDGEVHVALALSQPTDWKVEEGAARHGLKLKCVRPFPFALFAAHGYENKRHQVNRSFPMDHSQTFVFGVAEPSLSSLVPYESRRECSICGKTVDGREEAKTHLQTLKPPPTLFHFCVECHRLFADARGLQQHLDSMMGRTEFHQAQNRCVCRHPPASISAKREQILLDKSLIPQCSLCSGCWLCTPECRVRTTAQEPVLEKKEQQ